jgi:putative peptide zinc metalloprotease protein
VTEAIFSPSWYRVAKMRPRLRSHVQIHRHLYRGEVWYVLQDHASGRFHRFSPLTLALVGVMDGRRTVDEIWRSLCERFGDDAPTQEEVITLLAQLHSADALVSDAAPDTAELSDRAQQRRRLQLAGYWRNPIAVRVPLFDPDRLLGRLLPLFSWLFSKGGLALWCAVVGFGVVQAGLHWSELTADITDRVLGLENVLLLALIFPVVKVLHELGHGLAVKRWKGEVHELGVIFLVFFPTPYVDASAASAFPAARQRIIVDAAGMLTELLVAALAMFVWLNVQPGVVRSITFNTMLIAGVSTLFFNGNPLLRYDAYYILMDWLEIPNLASRANRYLGYLLQHYVFGLRDAKSPATAPGEAPWFVFFAIASFVYRMFVIAVITLIVASKYFVLGVALAIWGLASSVVWPLAKQVAYLGTAEALEGRRARALTAVGIGTLGVVALLAAVPVPYRTVEQGVVWTPEESWVRAGAQGVVAAVLAESGQPVTAGMPLLRLEDAALTARVAMLKGQVAEARARYDVALTSDRVAIAPLREAQRLAEDRLADAEAREADLVVRSPADGVLLLPRPSADVPGTFVQRGEALAYVVDGATLTARVAVPQADVDLVRERSGEVQVRLAGAFDRVLPANVVREVPAATAELPSDALSLAGGGQFATDPRARNAQTAFQPLFVFDLELAASPGSAPRLGERVYVRFDHRATPLATQWYRRLRQLLLERLDV